MVSIRLDGHSATMVIVVLPKCFVNALLHIGLLTMVIDDSRTVVNPTVIITLKNWRREDITVVISSNFKKQIYCNDTKEQQRWQGSSSSAHTKWQGSKNTKGVNVEAWLEGGMTWHWEASVKDNRRQQYNTM